MSATDSVKPIEIKGTALSVLTIQLGTLELSTLRSAMTGLFGNDAGFFDNDAAVLDFANCTADNADWPALLEQLRRYGLQPVAFCNGSDALRAAAREAGLVEVAGSALMRSTRSRPAAAPKAEAPAKPVAAPQEAQPELELAPAAPAPAEPPPAPTVAAAAPASTMVIDKPLRSGQRIYARGCDLIVLDIVSAGAEIIADGNIHVYAPLRGRAIAGALGDADARIFATCFEPELVAIAGVYRTFENDFPDQLAQKPVQVTLGTSASGERSSLQVQALALR